jgi:hypothetical protein
MDDSKMERRLLLLWALGVPIFLIFITIIAVSVFFLNKADENGKDIETVKDNEDNEDDEDGDEDSDNGSEGEVDLKFDLIGGDVEIEI